MYALVSNTRLNELIAELTNELDELAQDQTTWATSLYAEVSEELRVLVSLRRRRQTLGEM